MGLKLINSLGGKKQDFRPLFSDKVKVYYCGPTPYNYAHIGNLRAYLFEDFVVRTLRFLGYKVHTVMNITDIDDKTIRDSQKTGKSLVELTKFYTEEFLKDIDRLSIVRADKIVPISTLIEEMGKMIQGLIDNGYAYASEDGGVYYSVRKFKNYGELANLDMSGMISSVRINNDEYGKEQVADFALWKAYDPATDGPNVWEISLSLPKHHSRAHSHSVVFPNSDNTLILKGRPGWHIECSACNMHFFGPQIDIHMGAIDNLFPHHQNEIAQSEGFSGKKFSNYWLHCGHLLVDNKKMAKSAGNFFTLQDVIDRCSHLPENIVLRAFRLMALQTRYRENFNFTFDRIEAASITLYKIDEFLKRISWYNGRDGRVREKFSEYIQKKRLSYVERLEDDINTPLALNVVFEVISYVNCEIDNENLLEGEKELVMELLGDFDKVLDILNVMEGGIQISVPDEFMQKLNLRNAARRDGNFQIADQIRNELKASGWKILDLKDGTSRLERLSLLDR